MYDELKCVFFTRLMRLTAQRRHIELIKCWRSCSKNQATCLLGLIKSVFCAERK
jgi:hypothetical protein